MNIGLCVLNSAADVKEVLLPTAHTQTSTLIANYLLLWAIFK